MVKENKNVRTVCLDPAEPCAREYNHPRLFERVTVPDAAPSLYQMITTATVGSMPGNSPAYNSPDFEDDDEAHDHPDYEKLNQLDPIEKENFVNDWLNKPENYEQKEKLSEKTDAKGSASEKSADEGTEAAQGHV